MQNRIFSFDSAKAIKAKGYGYLNTIHYMAPFDVAGAGNLCPHASAGCRALCLGLWSGQAGMVAGNSTRPQGNNVRLSRVVKARRFMRDRANYMIDVVRSIELLEARAMRNGLQLCVRLNGSSDIAWEGIACKRNGHDYNNLFAAFPDIQFVDYTKNPRRFARALPANYHLTFSHSEINLAQCLDLLTRGHNVAVVFAGDKPKLWYGHSVIDGDLHDLRHLDPKGGYVIALSPKGRKAKRDKSGFVVRPGQQQQYAMAA